jgi:hypothetical protein
VLAIAGLLAAAALTACSDGGTDTTSPTVTTAPPATGTPGPPASTSTTLGPTTTVTSRPPATAASSPEVAAKALYDAWMRSDRAAAARVAQPAAVTTLFGRSWQAGDGWSFGECTGAAGSLVCTWLRPGGQQLMMRVQNSPASVAEVRFQP